MKEEKRIKRIMKKQIALNLAVIALFVLLLNFSILLYPAEGMQTRNNTVRFTWLGFASHALIDDNQEFTSPVIAEKDKALILEPGKYYWCVPFFSSCIKKSSFEIESEVSVIAKEVRIGNENKTYIENTGNVASKIEVKSLLGRLITGFFILQPDAANIVQINETAEITAAQIQE